MLRGVVGTSYRHLSLLRDRVHRELWVWWENGKGFLLVGCSRKKTISGETWRKELGDPGSESRVRVSSEWS